MSNFTFENPWDDNKKKVRKKEDIDEIIKNGQKKLLEFMNKSDKKPSNGGDEGDNNMFNFDNFDFFNKRIILIIALVIAVMWLSTGFYTVQPDEQGVVMRFGKYVRTTPSGLNYKLPYPVEEVTKISVTRINKEEVGFRSSGKRITSRQELLENTVSYESQMLTTDENIVDINFEVQWIISDAEKYLFNVRDLAGENTVKSAAESAMREVIGLASVSDILAEERSKIEQDAKLLLQQMLDGYGYGVQIVRLQLLRSEPPQEVIDAYRDVQNAKQDRENEINQAFAYRNDIIPRARGEAEQMMQQAEGYRQKVIAEAQGESERFSKIFEQYVGAKDVTRKRMYLETMENIMDGMDKIIIDKSSNSGVVPYLPLEKLEQKASKPKEKAAPAATDPTREVFSEQQ